MRALLGVASLGLSLVALLAGAAGAWRHFLTLVALSAACLIPLWTRGGRRIAAGPLIHLAVYTLLVLGSLVCLQVLVTNRHWEWDLTANRRQSLSPLTGQQVRSFESPIDITAIANEPTALRQSLDRLRSLNPRLRYRILNSLRDSREIARLAESWGLASIGPGTVILTSTAEGQERRATLQAGDGAAFRFDEQRWVNAMIQITRAQAPVVHFTRDHGERNPQTELTTVRALFEDLAFDVSQGTAREIPAGAALVVVAGPRQDFDEEDIAALQRHFDGGGSALILLDPPGSTPLARLERWIEQCGVAVRPGVIADDNPAIRSRLGITDGRSVLIVTGNDGHPVTEGFEPLLLRGARAFGMGRTEGNELTVDELLRTPPRHTWLTPGGDTLRSSEIPPSTSPDRQSFPVAMAVTRQPGGTAVGAARLVVIGDSEWATDELMRIPLLREGGERLLRGAVGWLVRQPDLIAIPPRTPPETLLRMTPAQRRVASALSVVLLPEVLLVLGVGLMLSRDRPLRESRSLPLLWGALVPLLAGSSVLAFGFGQPLIAFLLILASGACLLPVTFGPEGHTGRALACRLALWMGPLLALGFGVALLRARTSGEARLHPLAIESLSRLARDITVHAVASDPVPVTGLLTRLAQATPRLRWRVLDPRTDRAEIDRLDADHTVHLRDGDSLVVGGEGLGQGEVTRKVVPGLEDEERWVNSLLQVGQRTPLRLLVTEGHGEWSLSREMLGLQIIFSQLAISATQGPLSATARPDAVLIPGVTGDFSEEEIAWLDEHVERGGGLAVFLDPPTAAHVRRPTRVTSLAEPTRLVAWLESRWGLRLPPVAVVDDDPQWQELGLGTLSPMISIFDQHHPVSRRVYQRILDLQRQPGQGELAVLLLKEARAIAPSEPPAHADSAILFATRDNTWAETDLDTLVAEARVAPDTEPRMSLCLGLAAALHRPARSARLLLTGDSDCLSDAEQTTLAQAGIAVDPWLALVRGAIGWVLPEQGRAFFADPHLSVSLTHDAHAARRQSRAASAALGGIALLVTGGIGIALRRHSRREAGILWAGILAIAASGALDLRVPGNGSTQPPAESHLSSIPLGQISAIQIENGGQSMSLALDGESWRVQDSNRLARQEAVDLLLRMIDARRRGSPQPLSAGADLEAVGLDPPVTRLTLTARGGQSEALLLGHAPAQSFTQIWARVEGDDHLFTVDDDLARLLRRLPERWLAEESTP